jgi:hypothetical protein
LLGNRYPERNISTASPRPQKANKVNPETKFKFEVMLTMQFQKTIKKVLSRQVSNLNVATQVATSREKV